MIGLMYTDSVAIIAFWSRGLARDERHLLIGGKKQQLGAQGTEEVSGEVALSNDFLWAAEIKREGFVG